MNVSASSVTTPVLLSVSIPDSTPPIPHMESYLRASCPNTHAPYLDPCRQRKFKTMFLRHCEQSVAPLCE